MAKRKVDMSPAARARRSAAGKLKVARGVALEGFLIDQGQLLKGRALYEHRPNPLKVLRPNPLNPREFVCAKQAASGVDFDGVLKGGKAFYFDAKSTNDGAAFELSLLSAHQRTYLINRARFGAVCFVYVRATGLEGHRPYDYILPIGAEGTIAGAVPHDELLAPDGVKRLRWSELSALQVGAAETWLDAAERIAGAGLWR